MFEPLLGWLVHKDQPVGLAFPCFLPECRRLVMRTSLRRQPYYCGPQHARVARSRQRQLRELVDRLRHEADVIPIGASGRPTTRRGRELLADLDFTLRILNSYGGTSEEG